MSRDNAVGAQASDPVLLLRGAEVFCSVDVCRFIPSSSAGAYTRGARALGFGAPMGGWT